MSDWLFLLPMFWMTVVIVVATALVTFTVYWVVTRLASDERRALTFKSISPGMLPPLGIIFGLMVGFTAAQVWADFDRAKLALANEVNGLKAVLFLSEVFPPSDASHLRSLVKKHVEHTISEEWPAMAEHRATLAMPPVMLSQALAAALALKPTDDGQRIAQSEMVDAVESTMDARRQRIVISGSEVSPIKWAGLLLQGLITLIAIAMVHSGNHMACAIALSLFGTGIALSVLLIAAYDLPFTGDVAVGPELLQHVLMTIKP